MAGIVGTLLGKLRSAGDTAGTAALEAAIVAPVLLVLAVGTIEFGNMLYNATLIQTGLRDAARYLARVDSPMDAEQEARNLAITGSVTGDAPPRVAWWDGGDITISLRSTDNLPAGNGRRPLRGGDAVFVVRVATEIDYSGLGTLGALGRDSIKLAFAHEERVVGN